MAANVDACIMCCPLNHHTKGLLGAKVSVLIFVLICAVVLGLVCVLICALYGCLSFCVSYVHMCPYMCPYVCPYMQYVVFSMVQHTHTHTHTPGCERCPRVRLLLLYSLLVLNYFTLYYPLPNYSSGAAGVVEREALVSLLTQRHLGGLAIDVFWKGALLFLVALVLLLFLPPVLCAPTLFISTRLTRTHTYTHTRVQSPGISRTWIKGE
jgi:hypothetical protein